MFVFVGILYGVGLLAYPYAREIYPWPSTLETVLLISISAGCTLGMHGTFFAIYYRSTSSYSEALWSIIKFRKNSTQRALLYLGDWSPKADKKHVSNHLEFNMAKDEESLNISLKLHDYLFEELATDFVHYEGTNNGLILTTGPTIAALLLLSFTYTPEDEMVVVVLMAFSLLNITVLTTCLIFIVKINLQLHDYFVKDLERIRYLLEDGKGQGDSTKMVSIIENKIRALKADPKFAGRMLGVKITKESVAKLLVSLLAAMASAILRLGLAE
ncbi:hypothetical protein TrST_g13865 [Triparma strigata]|uniref:Uncharacterized protein n=1 Tax=Triparma strigata TaxID=1606541 RepID=A0A9W7AYF7_9STRA|nr:hypothetical protein TrST_g13865 [Triparma strigata]